MCDDITYEDLDLPSVAGMYDKTCKYRTYNDLKPDVCKKLVLGLMI